MSAGPGLTNALKKLVLRLETDMRARLDAHPVVLERWRREHREAVARKRTAASWLEWRNDRMTQAAVAWVLTTVFIRFCEDNGLVRPVWISGPGQRRQEALDARDAFFREHPEETDREWLQQAIGHLPRLRATAALVDEHSALRLVSPSGQAATEILEFWWQRGEDGAPVYDLADPALSTRFLGDLYQDLSDHAKATYALLQTPEFVEEFILDRTLEPALRDRPLEGFRMIDPTCGSGHFLLGAFARLLERWHRHAPGMELQARVQTALDAIHGVDLNPFAVAIARFRLTVAAMQACGLRSLESAPAFQFHMAVGDSLLHGAEQQALGLEGHDRSDAALSGFAYSTEDLAALRSILEPGRYDVVVGNPPFIAVGDKALKSAYRDRYSACSGLYAMTVPFMQRFFDLAKPAVGDQPAGWVGQITSNSFMKREFGARLIEDFLSMKDLRLVADTSGAYIPGHGTPTVIIVGRPQAPTLASVRAVLFVRGEPGRVTDPARGVVWRSIVDHVDEVGWEDNWITVAEVDRKALSRHPWSLTGGGAGELSAQIAAASTTPLGHRTERIGLFGDSHEDQAFFHQSHWLRSLQVPVTYAPKSIRGDQVRDWIYESDEAALFPYDRGHAIIPLAHLGVRGQRYLWTLRTVLGSRRTFGGGTYFTDGRVWYGWHQLPVDASTSESSITFAEIATHNHFVLDRGGKVFNRTAPVIKLPAGATEEVHLALLGALNSSTACFWLKEKSYNKGEGGGARVDAGYAARGEPYRENYDFTATTLLDYPLPTTLPVERGRVLDCLAQHLLQLQPASIAASTTPNRMALDDARATHDTLQSQMISQQEELDWGVYRLYGLIDDDLAYAGPDLPILRRGERAFEIKLARAVRDGAEQTTWFEHNGATPVTEMPTNWPLAYQELVQRRLDLIASNPAIRLLEKPEYKRCWAIERWENREESALRGWLLDRLEDRRFWFDPQGRPTPRSVGQLADEVARDADLVSVLALWEGRPDVPITRSLTRLLEDEAVPYLAAHRYKDSGLDKRAAWEETWALQRREDASEHVDTITVPPKYTSADFRNASYWRHRGKLDVPKERFILYPDAGRDTDPTPLLGWAGWDHAQQSLALSQVIGAREAEGWPDERLEPLVAGLAELQPWVDQWHSAMDSRFGVSFAAFCREQLTTRAAQVGMSVDELARYRMPAPPRRSRKER